MKTNSVLALPEKPRQPKFQQGFTLLEMVLVLFLLGLMASGTLLLTEGVEGQAKYDETKHRLTMIRTAIIGDSTRTINGRPEISGFASDMGRLPNCLRELLTARLCDDSADLALWQQDADSDVWSGWRGPYLTGNTELSGITHFRDGYGNSGDTAGIPSADWQNSGWSYTAVNGNIIVISNGFDITTNTDDIPRATAVQELVFAADHQVSLGEDWRSVNVHFYSKAAERFIAEKSLRLKINSPVDGAILDYASAEMFMSSAFPVGNDLYVPANNGVIAADNNHSITFSSAVTLSDATTVGVPAGTVITYNKGIVPPADSGMFSCASDCTLTIPNTGRTFLPAAPPLPSTITKIEFSASANVTLAPHLISPVGAPNFTKRAITVPAGSILDKPARKLTLQNGATITFSGDEPDLLGDNVAFDNAQITVSEGFSRVGNTITTTSSADTFIVPSSTVVTGPTTLEVSLVSVFNAGVKSFTIVCDLAADPEQGSLFDGDCTDNVDNNISSPTNLTLLPKNTLAVNDEAIEWVIQ